MKKEVVVVILYIPTNNVIGQVWPIARTAHICFQMDALQSDAESIYSEL